MDSVQNFAKATVAQGYDDSATEIDIEVGDSAKLSPAAPFNLIWWNATDYPDPADDPNVEIVRCTDRDGETLTISRAQESTFASDHNAAGKTYKVMQSFTEQTITDLVGDVFGGGTAILVSAGDGTIEMRQSATRGVTLSGGSTAIKDSSAVDIGDIDGNNNSSFVNISDQNQRFSLIGMDLATDRIESASGPVGNIVGKLAIRDNTGAVVRYLPIYDSIT